VVLPPPPRDRKSRPSTVSRAWLFRFGSFDCLDCLADALRLAEVRPLGDVEPQGAAEQLQVQSLLWFLAKRPWRQGAQLPWGTFVELVVPDPHVAGQAAHLARQLPPVAYCCWVAVAPWVVLKLRPWQLLQAWLSDTATKPEASLQCCPHLRVTEVPRLSADDGPARQALPVAAVVLGTQSCHCFGCHCDGAAAWSGCPGPPHSRKNPPVAAFAVQLRRGCLPAGSPV